MLKVRVITSVVTVLSLLAALFLLEFPYFVGVLVAVFSLAAWEWANLSSLQRTWQRALYALLVALSILACIRICGLHTSLINHDYVRDLLLLACTWWSVALLWVKTYPNSAMLWGHKMIRSFLGFLVLVPAAIALLYALRITESVWLFLYIIGIVASADIGAYFIGRKWGKRKLAPNVSPGKSWAGFFGGLFSSIIYSIIVALFFPILALSLLEFVVISFVATAASVLGDLLESMLKRHRGIKDSGRILPGHGGIMDRVDSITAAAPVFVLLMLLLGAR